MAKTDYRMLVFTSGELHKLLNSIDSSNALIDKVSNDYLGMLSHYMAVHGLKATGKIAEHEFEHMVCEMFLRMLNEVGNAVLKSMPDQHEALVTLMTRKFYSNIAQYDDNGVQVTVILTDLFPEHISDDAFHRWSLMRGLTEYTINSLH